MLHTLERVLHTKQRVFNPGLSWGAVAPALCALLLGSYCSLHSMDRGWRTPVNVNFEIFGETFLFFTLFRGRSTGLLEVLCLLGLIRFCHCFVLLVRSSSANKSVKIKNGTHILHGNMIKFSLFENMNNRKNYFILR